MFFLKANIVGAQGLSNKTCLNFIFQSQIAFLTQHQTSGLCLGGLYINYRNPITYSIWTTLSCLFRKLKLFKCTCKNTTVSMKRKLILNMHIHRTTRPSPLALAAVTQFPMPVMFLVLIFLD